MLSMLWSTPSINNSFAYQYPDDYSQSYSQNKIFDMSKRQKPTPRVKGDLSSSKPKVEKLVSKPKISTNKPGPKAIWVLLFPKKLTMSCRKGGGLNTTRTVVLR